MDYETVADKVQYYFHNIYENQLEQDKRFIYSLNTDNNNYERLKAVLNRMDVKMTGFMNQTFLVD